MAQWTDKERHLAGNLAFPDLTEKFFHGKSKGPLQVQMDERTTWPDWCCHGYTKSSRQPEAASQR